MVTGYLWIENLVDNTYIETSTPTRTSTSIKFECKGHHIATFGHIAIGY